MSPEPVQQDRLSCCPGVPVPKPGTRQARGYDADHDAQRRAWQPVVDRGEATCHAVRCLEPTRRIPARGEWHLGHNPERTRWTGPEHPRCNTSEGATRGNAMRATAVRHSREW